MTRSSIDHTLNQTLMIRRTSSQSVGDGSPKPRPYPKSSAMVFAPNRLSGSFS
jgi:hypothetical protein